MKTIYILFSIFLMNCQYAPARDACMENLRRNYDPTRCEGAILFYPKDEAARQRCENNIVCSGLVSWNIVSCLAYIEGEKECKQKSNFGIGIRQ